MDGEKRQPHERLDPRDSRTTTLLVGVLLGWTSLIAIAGGGGAGEWIFRTTPTGPGITDLRSVNPTVRERGELMIGGSSLDGSAVLARESPVGVGGNAPDGSRRTIAVAVDGAIAIFTSNDLIAVDVRDHLATAEANSATIPSEVMVIAGQSGGIVRAVATDATGGVAITDSGNDVTVSGSTDAPFTQGAGADTADTMRTSMATTSTLALDMASARASVAAINSETDSLAVVGAGAQATSQRMTIATDSTVALEVAAAQDSLAAIDSDTTSLSVLGAGAQATAQRTTIASDSTVALDLAAARASVAAIDSQTDAINDGTVGLEAGTATVGSVSALGRTALGAQQQLLVAADGTVRVDPTGTTSQPVTDGGGSLTVDAPVGTPAFVRLSDGAAAQGGLANPLFARLSDSVDQSLITAAGELNVLASAQPGVDVGDVTLTASTATIGSVVAIQQGDYITLAGTNFLVQTAFTNFVTAGAEEREIVAAQGAGNSIAVIAWIITTDNATRVRFENGAAATALTLPVRLASDGSGWTADFRHLWFETSDNQALDLDSNATMTGACQVWYVVR